MQSEYESSGALWRAAGRSINILIMDDHPAILLGLRSMLSEVDGITVVGTLRNGNDLPSLPPDVLPDVVLMDLRMPGMRGPECIAAIRTRFPAANILVISSFEMDEEIFTALEAGARGYLSKDASEEEILRAIRRVHSGLRSLPPRINQRLRERNGRDDLTARELEILHSVARGLTSKQIAELLALSEYTVRNHVNSILGKLQVQDRTEAAVFALKKGLVRLEDV